MHHPGRQHAFHPRDPARLLLLCLCISASSTADASAIDAGVTQLLPRASQMPAAAWINTTWEQQDGYGEAYPPMLCAPNGKDAAGLKYQQQSSSAGATGATPQGIREATERIKDFLPPVLLVGGGTGAREATEKKTEEDFTCKGPNGEEVAWFIVLKESGSFRYVYATSSNPTFSAAHDEIHERGPVHKTLTQTAQPNAAVLLHAYSSFNSSQNQGHQNGVLMFGKRKGFWLIHTWRRLFSYFRAQEYPNRNYSKGQSFICTTHGIRDLEDIGRQLFITKPNPEIDTLLRNEFFSEDSYWVGIRDEQSVRNNAVREICGESGRRVHRFGNRPFVHYSKSRFGDQEDIYNWIAADNSIEDRSEYQLKVQAWRFGQAAIPPVVQIDLHTIPGLNQMKQNTDHSKWCVPVRTDQYKHGNRKFVCIGDLNIKQTKRPGGAMCLYNDAVWEQFKNIAKGS